MQTGYRIARTDYSGSHNDMFSGAGASLYAGRWNSKGTHMVYASDSRALAMLEITVNLKNAAALSAYSICDIAIPPELIETVGPEDLPDGWDEMVVNPVEAQSWGDLWVSVGATPAVMVPSIVVPDEWNILMNPEHEDFGRIVLGQILGLRIDPRIKGNPT